MMCGESVSSCGSSLLSSTFGPAYHRFPCGLLSVKTILIGPNPIGGLLGDMAGGGGLDRFVGLSGLALVGEVMMYAIDILGCDYMDVFCV